MPTNPKELKFVATGEKGKVPTLLIRPRDPQVLLVLGHGARTNMRHTFLEGLSEHLAEVGVATFGYQFPYMEGYASRISRTVFGCCTIIPGAASGNPARVDRSRFPGFRELLCAVHGAPYRDSWARPGTCTVLQFHNMLAHRSGLLSGRDEMSSGLLPQAGVRPALLPIDKVSR